MQHNQKLKIKITELPDLPGVYLMKNDQGDIIYCGKAASLKKRVPSYFRPKHEPNPRRRLLSSQINDFEYIVTDSELEALILESNLIKKHRPRFNVLLRDDKHYPHLCLTLNEAFPRLRVVRRIKKDGNMYFGPYTPANAMRQTLRLIHRIFPVRRCRGPLPKSHKRPCLNHQMGLCRAPCAGLITRSEYQELIREIVLFLQGRKEDLENKLREEMEAAALDHRYERAAILRDQLLAIENCLEKQHVYTSNFEDEDYLAFDRDEDRACIQVFFIRFGRMTGRKALQLFDVKDIPDNELMEIVLEQFYDSDKTVPPCIQVEILPANAGLLQTWLSSKRGAKVRIHVPQRGDKRKLILMVKKNAALDLKGPVVDGHFTFEEILTQAKHDLNIPKLPRRIEGFDISNLGPTEAVGSMVFWKDTMPIKSRYRRFKIRGVEGIDDYGMMAEVLRRRYTRLLKENEDMPDLILIDGGKGHLQAGLNVLSELGLNDISIISLAKREELIYLPKRNEPLSLPSRSSTLQLFQRIRDEAHRFALSYQRLRRTKRAFSSSLDNISGVGRKRKERLLKHFSGVNGIKRATISDLVSISGIDRNTANKVYEYFHRREEKN
ncbi:MAG: excinuclease ABC subunit UvrC [bacterium]